MESLFNMKCIICKKMLTEVQQKRGNQTCSIECRGKQHSLLQQSRNIIPPHWWDSKNKKDIARKISLSNQGLHHSPPTEFKRGKSKPIKAYSFPRGEEHPCWKGGTYSSERHTLMGRIEYKIWRKTVFERDNYTCQFCGKRGGKLNADHIKPFARFKKLRLDVNNGRTLCESCHKNTPTYGGRS